MGLELVSKYSWVKRVWHFNVILQKESSSDNRVKSCLCDFAVSTLTTTLSYTSSGGIINSSSGSCGTIVVLMTTKIIIHLYIKSVKVVIFLHFSHHIT